MLALAPPIESLLCGVVDAAETVLSLFSRALLRPRPDFEEAFFIVIALLVFEARLVFPFFLPASFEEKKFSCATGSSVKPALPVSEWRILASFFC